ncbi:MAG: hypothetical protein WC343_11430 [Bacilli bacterium]|jgi:hypothetical protein
MDWNWTYIIKFIGVALSIFVVDICWAKYFIYVNKHKPMPAAIWGSVILLFGAFATIEYVNDKTLIIAAFIGGFFGTYLTVWLEKRKLEKQNDNLRR